MTPFSRLTPDDAAACLELSQAEDWPHRIEDWQMMLNLGQGWGLVRKNRLIATGILMRHGTRDANLGGIIVHAEWRRRGLARQLVAHLLEQAPDAHCHLNATESGAPLYRQMGFRDDGLVQQFQGQVVSDQPRMTPDMATAEDLPELVTLDRAATGMSRLALLTVLQQQGHVNIQRSRTRPGIDCAIFVRRFGLGEILGPVLCTQQADPGPLMEMTLAQHAGRFLRIDIAEAGAPLIPLVREAGLEHVGRAVSMNRGAHYRLRSARHMALASQALG